LILDALSQIMIENRINPIHVALSALGLYLLNKTYDYKL